MTVKFISGDLFESRAQVLAHGCNCRGKMGAGIAVEFRSRFPGMYREYRKGCYKEEYKPGDLMLYRESSPWVLNMFTQADLGGARMQHVRACINELADSHKQLGICHPAMPRIAAGLGGLDWQPIKALLIEKMDSISLLVEVYEY